MQSYCAIFFHFSLSFCWVFLAYSNLHYLALKKLPKLPTKKERKKAFCVSARYPFTGRNSRISPVQPVRSIFFPVQNKGVIYIGLLAGTVYTDRTSQYSTELTSLIFVFDLGKTHFITSQLLDIKTSRRFACVKMDFNFLILTILLHHFKNGYHYSVSYVSIDINDN